MARSGSGSSAIFASTALSSSAAFPRGPRRAAAFSSLARSFIAPRSSVGESLERHAGRRGALGGLLRRPPWQASSPVRFDGTTLMLGAAAAAAAPKLLGRHLSHIGRDPRSLPPHRATMWNERCGRLFGWFSLL